MAQFWEFEFLLNDNSGLRRGKSFSYLPNRTWTQWSSDYSEFFTYLIKGLSNHRGAPAGVSAN